MVQAVFFLFLLMRRGNSGTFTSTMIVTPLMHPLNIYTLSMHTLLIPPLTTHIHGTGRILPFSPDETWKFEHFYEYYDFRWVNDAYVWHPPFPYNETTGQVCVRGWEGGGEYNCCIIAFELLHSNYCVRMWGHNVGYSSSILT